MIEAWLFIAASLLAVSGGAKLIDAAPTSGALRAMGLPSGRLVVQAIGVGETVAAVGGIAIGGVALFGMGAVYLGFAGFIAVALRRGVPIRSCGCFGKADTPPTIGHLVFNLVSAAVAFGGAVAGTVPWHVLREQPLAALPYLGFVALGVWVVYLLLAELPGLGARGR